VRLLRQRAHLTHFINTTNNCNRFQTNGDAKAVEGFHYL